MSSFKKEKKRKKVLQIVAFIQTKFLFLKNVIQPFSFHNISQHLCDSYTYFSMYTQAHTIYIKNKLSFNNETQVYKCSFLKSNGK